MLTPSDTRATPPYCGGMLTHHFTVSVHAYSDATFSVTVLDTRYLRGVQQGVDLKRCTWCTEGELMNIVELAAAETVQLARAQLTVPYHVD